MAKQPSSDLHPRTIRIFISSTFRDMQAERDILIKQIFPQLKKICDQKNITLTEVDLRWGITDEQRSEDQVLPICLEEIKNCHPFFIGLLGERYGWVPDEIPRKIIDQEPWLEQFNDNSVTELEILHGVLNNPEASQHAYFYFRDPAFIEAFSPMEQNNYREIPTADEIAAHGLEHAQKLANQRKQKLIALKKRIRESGFPLQENYASPAALGEMVLRDLRNLIETLYPSGENMDLLQLEREEHEYYATRLAKGFVGRSDCFVNLNKHANGKGNPWVVYDKAGMGKSAFLAKWAIDYRKKHPEDLVLMHFIGCSPNSTDWSAMLQRFMGEFKRLLGIEEMIPKYPDDVRTAFEAWLHQVAEKKRVILVIDSLDQLEDKEGALDLQWLPLEFPDNIRVILSVLPGRVHDELAKRNWAWFSIGHLNVTDRKQLIHEYLAPYKKTLSLQQIDHIANSFQTGNPLFLSSLLEELRIFGVHEKLDERINYYLSAKKITVLFNLILKRYEQDYEEKRPELVQDMMTLLWAARCGLSESELLDLLGQDGTSLPRAYWTPLFLAAEKSLLVRSGRVNIGNNYLRRAVQDLYLPSEKDQLAVHAKLAVYFSKIPLCPRKVEETLWHLSKSQDWKALTCLLTDLEYLKFAWSIDPLAVKQCWGQIENNSPLRIVDGYRFVFENLPAYQKYLWVISELLFDTGHLTESLSILEFLVEVSRQNEDQKMLIHVLSKQAQIYEIRGEGKKAFALLQEQEAISRRLQDWDSLQSALGYKALILATQLDIDGAMSLSKEQEQICRQHENLKGLQFSLCNQGIIFRMRGEVNAALLLFQKQEQICKSEENRADLQSSFGHQAVLYYMQGDYLKALNMAIKQEKICRELGDKNGLQFSLNYQAKISLARGELDNSLALSKKQKAICQEIGKHRGLQAALENHGMVLRSQGDFVEADKLFTQQNQICRTLEDEIASQLCKKNQGLLLMDNGETREFFEILLQQEHFWRKLGDRYHLQSNLFAQGVVLYERGKIIESLSLFERQELTCRELGYLDWLQMSLGRQALAQYKIGNKKKALTLVNEHKKLYIKIHGKYNNGLEAHIFSQIKPNQVLRHEQKYVKDLRLLSEKMDLNEFIDYSEQMNNLKQKRDTRSMLAMHMKRFNEEGGLQNAAPRLPNNLTPPKLDMVEMTFDDLKKISARATLSNIDKRLEQYKKDEDLYRALKDYDNVQKSLYQQAKHLKYDKRKLPEALALLKKQETLCRQHNLKNGLQKAIGLQAEILLEQKNHHAAQNLYKEQETLCRQLNHQRGLQSALGGLALLQLDTADEEGAISLFREQEKLCRQFNIPNGLQSALGRLGEIYFSRGEWNIATNLFDEMERISRETGNRTGWETALNNQNLVYQAQADLLSLRSNHQKIVDYYHEIKHPTMLFKTIGNLVITLCSLGKFETARKYNKELRKHYKWVSSLQGKIKSVYYFLDGQGEIFLDPYNLNNNYSQLEKLACLFRKQEKKNGLQTVLGIQALLHAGQWKLNTALDVYQKQEVLCREIDDNKALQLCLGSQAAILKHQGDIQGAMALYEKQEQLCRELREKESLQICLGGQGCILLHLGKTNEAMSSFKEQEKLCDQLQLSAGLQSAYGGLGKCFTTQNNFSTAFLYFEKQETICRETENYLGLQSCLDNQAAILKAQGKEKAALVKEKERADICNAINYKPG
jgi:hypothetical protein